MSLSHRSTVGLVLVALSWPSLTSCSGQDEPADEAVTLTAEDGTLVFVSAPGDDGMTALTEGPLQVENGCLGIADFAVIWPSGTSVSDQQPLTIDVPGIGATRLGDTIAIGGGFVYEPTSDGPPSEQSIDVGGADVPTKCLQGGLFLASAG